MLFYGISINPYQMSTQFYIKLRCNHIKNCRIKKEFLSFSVDESKLTFQKNQQNDALAEITDETAAICSNIHRIYRDIDRYNRFNSTNPLSKFVPKTETFNGKTYQDYEREFMMYYKMIQKADGL